MDLYIAAAVVAVLLAALVLCQMQPRRKAGKASPDTTITVEVALNGADEVSAQLEALAAKAELIAKTWPWPGASPMALPVRNEPPMRTGQVPPKRMPPSPPPAPAKKRRTR